MKKSKYRRVVLKISGEGFCKTGQKGIDVKEMNFLAREIFQIAQTGIQLAVVVGGGNIVRGSQFAKFGVSNATGDYMGMIATVINALALQ
ncbi:MAG: UMP kinase, partial [Planctomycetes bacterium]|nr:UMP kinase [Planctomycetota bacterium]